MAIELGLIASISVFNPVFATYRLDQTPADRTARTLSAWSVTSNATVAALTAVWGLLASLTSLRVTLAIAGLLLLATPLLLPRHDHASQRDRGPEYPNTPIRSASPPVIRANGNLTAWPDARHDRIRTSIPTMTPQPRPAGSRS